MSLTFASVLTAHKHIYQALNAPTIEFEMTRHPNKDIFRGVSLSIDNNICGLFEFIRSTLGGVSPDCVVRCKFGDFSDA